MNCILFSTLHLLQEHTSNCCRKAVVMERETERSGKYDEYKRKNKEQVRHGRGRQRKEFRLLLEALQAPKLRER